MGTVIILSVFITISLLIWFFVIITDIRTYLRHTYTALDYLTQIVSTNIANNSTPDVIEQQNSTIKVHNDGKYKILPSHVDCPECGASVNATPCPNCGYHIENNEDK